MLPPHVEAEIQALLAAGLSYRRTAAAVGVSRGVVLDVLTGRRAPDKSRRKAEQTGSWAPAVRCPDCGSLLNAMPCLACEVQALRLIRLSDPPPEQEAMTVELHFAELARYQPLRSARDAAARALGIDADPPTDDPAPLDVIAPSVAELLAIAAEGPE
jgi:hypothetical protein